MLCPKAHERDYVVGGDERVRDHTLVVKRQRGYRGTVDEREQDLALELARIVQTGEPANDAGLSSVHDPQLQAGRVRRGTVAGPRRRRGRSGRLS